MIGGSIRWGVYTVGDLYGGGSIRWVVLYGGESIRVGGSIRWGVYTGGLFGGDSIWYAVYRWGILFFFPFGYLGINYPSVLGDPEKCLTRSIMV